MSSELKTNKISPATGTLTTLGDASDVFQLPASAEIDIASGATLDVNGTVDFTGATVSGLSTWENTPNFYVKTNADQSWSSSYTKFVFNTLVSESDTGSFDTTTNYRFTVPSGKGGTYLFAHNFANQNGTNWYVKTLKNGTDELWWAQSSIDDAGGNQFRTHVVVAELSAGDYVEWLKYSGTSWTNMGSQLYGVRLHT
jgi:hypothetical protein